MLIPWIRLSHCPYLRISNVKPAHASDDISTHHGMVNPWLTDSRIYGSMDPRILFSAYIRKDSTPMNGVHLIIYIKGMLAAGRYKINPRERFLLHYRCTKFQICEIWLEQTVTFENVLSRLAVQMAWGLVPSMLFAYPPTHGQVEFNARKHRIRCKDKHFFVTSKHF